MEPRSGFEPLCPFGAGLQNPCNQPDYATLAKLAGLAVIETTSVA